MSEIINATQRAETLEKHLVYTPSLALISPTIATEAVECFQGQGNHYHFSLK